MNVSVRPDLVFACLSWTLPQFGAKSLDSAGRQYEIVQAECRVGPVFTARKWIQLTGIEAVVVAAGRSRAFCSPRRTGFIIK
jgi:hypothetical protein